MTIPPTDQFYIDSKDQITPKHPDTPKQKENYLAEPDLVKAVNLAIYLRRPLLLEGEAGCGKTRLAKAVAYDLGLPYYRWNVRSTSKAQEGLYEYDAILRLHDVQLQSLNNPNATATKKRDPSNPENYLHLGALGKAFALQDCPAVVLIDEIDKADVDFPNDLLTVLDEPWEFEIKEIEDKKITAKHEPIIIITSNREKGNLPPPFLRRCIYFFLEFPETRLKEIVTTHYQLKETESPMIEQAINRFLEVRQDTSLIKKPGTSEFLDWLHTLRTVWTVTNKEKLKQLEKELPIPYRELLFKHRQDWQKYKQAVS